VIERVHEHMVSELNAGARTDTVFVLTAVVLNLITLAVNSAVSSGSEVTATIVMFTFAALIVVINAVAVTGLARGRRMRTKLLDGLMRMYRDQQVEGYYDTSLIGDYRMRYSLFMLVVLFSGVVALVVPFVIR
jgi:hypothetical protein